MKIISWNVNGLRAVFKKGFLSWFKKANAGIVCLQEIKLQEGQIPEPLAAPEGYFSYFSYAAKKGYSGVAVYTREKPIAIEKKLGLKRFDSEGRILKLEFKDFILINFYMPHGGREKENLDYKIEVYKRLAKYLGKIKGKPLILAGDFNIAHEEIDLARPKDNKKNIMFTPEERRQIDRLIESGFTDTFRKFHPNEAGQYTWWPYFSLARDRNLGWRIDYVWTSKDITPKVKDAFILPNVFGSDHCPVGIEI
ncbi:MAG: exodeoxyribonuclease III [bacterium]|nr:exodeoxyribonuclease III [bacterium]